MTFFSSKIARLFFLATFFALPAAHGQGLYFNPGSINFTNTTAGSVSAEQTVSVQFIPSPPAAMSLNVTSMVPPNDAAFKVTSNTCPVGFYAPYAICEIKFTFTAPSTAGHLADQFRFVTNELENLNINLSGYSDGAPVVVTPTKPNPVPATGLFAIIFGGAAIGVTGVLASLRRRR
ncbi:hypothetical protein [Diaphorobacter sp.]|uniref:hypothetical protein n=1 Tax=Diaphorobacter sp. TaxID=1934310 RepID=UPI0028A6313E|nr:hypothetical protein [Diaphorobacter sp.]